MGCCEAEYLNLRSKTQVLVVTLFTESRGRASSLKKDDLKRKIDPNLVNMFTMLKGAATDPCKDIAAEGHKWQNQVLRARKALFINWDKCDEAGEFPFRKRKRLSSQNSSSMMVDQKKRRSRRLVDLEKFGEVLCTDPSTRIPIGRHAQAVVPDWIGPVGRHGGLEDNLDESRWLGTTVCSVKSSEAVIKRCSRDKGCKDTCGCVFPGSIECVKLHVRTARQQLKLNLGRTFFDWCFQKMGEEVSKSWPLKDQVMFDEIVRLNPESEGKSFWDEALKHFTNKSRKDLVSYYFNVYVLRWIRRYTRLKSEAADGDDNINDEDNRKALDSPMNINENSKFSSRRYLSRKF